MLQFVAITFCFALITLGINLRSFNFEASNLLLVIVECLFKLTAGCNCLHRQSFLTINFISQVMYFLSERIVFSLSLLHLLLGLIKLHFDAFFLICFYSEH